MVKLELRWLVDENNVGTLQHRYVSGDYTDGWKDVAVVREMDTAHHLLASMAVPTTPQGRHRYVEDTLTTKELAKQQGYTGDVCIQCGGCRMRRNGPCLVCEQCGQTTGCS